MGPSRSVDHGVGCLGGCVSVSGGVSEGGDSCSWCGECF